MITVTTPAGRTLKVQFQHTHGTLETSEGSVERPVTVCRICEAVPDNDQQLTELTTGVAVLNPEDRDDRRLARRIALLRATHPKADSPFAVDERKAIWAQYFQHCKDLRHNPTPVPHEIRNSAHQPHVTFPTPTESDSLGA